MMAAKTDRQTGAKPVPTVDPRFVIQQQGKDFVLYPGLVDLAHKQGLVSIITDPVQFADDTNGQMSRFKATVTMQRPVGDDHLLIQTFVGYGDANPRNVTRLMLTCLDRMAETRAKARALRDATNVGMTAYDELPGDDADRDDVDRAAYQAARQQHAAGGPPVPANRPPAAQPQAPKQDIFRPRGGDPAPGQGPMAQATDKQVAAAYAIGQSVRHLDHKGVQYKCHQLYGCDVEQMTRKDISEFMDLLKQDPTLGMGDDVPDPGFDAPGWDAKLPPTDLATSRRNLDDDVDKPAPAGKHPALVVIAGLHAHEAKAQGGRNVTLSQQQLITLNKLFNQVGAGDNRIPLVQLLWGQDVTSTKQLTASQAGVMIGWLGGKGAQADVDALVDYLDSLRQSGADSTALGGDDDVCDLCGEVIGDYTADDGKVYSRDLVIQRQHKDWARQGHTQPPTVVYCGPCYKTINETAAAS